MRTRCSERPSRGEPIRTHFCAIALLMVATLPVTAQRRVPKDLTGVRGFNYQSAETIGHAEFWLQYNPSVTERDLDYAVRLQLNQVRVFVPYAAWEMRRASTWAESSLNISMTPTTDPAASRSGSARTVTGTRRPCLWRRKTFASCAPPAIRQFKSSI